MSKRISFHGKPRYPSQADIDAVSQSVSRFESIKAKSYNDIQQLSQTAITNNIQIIGDLLDQGYFQGPGDTILNEKLNTYRTRYHVSDTRLDKIKNLLAPHRVELQQNTHENQVRKRFWETFNAKIAERHRIKMASQELQKSHTE
jgi:hypothetical protein